MLRASVIALAASVMFLTGCEDMFSLTPMEELGAFEVQTPLSQADATIESLATTHDLKVNRDPKPSEQAPPRDYLAAVAAGRCLLTVEGFGPPNSARVKVTLRAARGSNCDKSMRALFAELRKDLAANA